MSKLIKNILIAVFFAISIYFRNNCLDINLSESWLQVVFWVMLLAIAFIFTLFERIFKYAYDRFAFIRKVHHRINPESIGFIEGDWVDVSFSYTNGKKTYHSYSYIVIKYRSDKFDIRGISWNTSQQRESTWKSRLLPVYKNDELEFAYKAMLIQKRVNQFHTGVAKFTFMSEKNGEPQNYEGEFGLDNEFTVKAKKLFTASKESDQRMTCARQYYLDQRDHDRQGGEISEEKDLPQYSGSPVWFYTFIRSTNEKQNEKALIDNLPNRILKKLANCRSLIDLGCGPGGMSSFLLEKLFNKKTVFKYSGIDIDDDTLDLARQELGEKFPSAELNFSIGDLNHLHQRPIRGKFDLAIAFHSLYLVKDIDNFLKAAMIFVQKGVFLLMHTKESKILLEFQRLCNSPITNNVPNQIKQFFNKKKKRVSQLYLTEEIQFPKLLDKDWDDLKCFDDNTLLSDRASEALLLLCFLVQQDVSKNREAGNWKEYVGCVRDFLIGNNNKFPLEVYLQCIVLS